MVFAMLKNLVKISMQRIKCKKEAQPHRLRQKVSCSWDKESCSVVSLSSRGKNGLLFSIEWSSSSWNKAVQLCLSVPKRRMVYLRLFLKL